MANMYILNRYVTIQRGRKPAPAPERKEPNDIQVGNKESKRFSNGHHGRGIAERLAKLDRQRILRLRNRIKKRSLVSSAHIVYPTSHTSSDSTFPKSSLHKSNIPNSLKNQAASNSLPRTQGVHYIFPFSPQRKRDNRQIKINDHTDAPQEHKTTDAIPTLSVEEEGSGEEDDDYDGWDYEVSVDKTVAEEFSISKSISDMVDYITSTFAPPSTLLTKSTTEQDVTAETTTAASNELIEEITTESAVKSDDIKAQSTSKNRLFSAKQNFANNAEKATTAQQNLNAIRVHPFLANRKLQEQKLNSVALTIRPASRRHPFFKPRTTTENTTNHDIQPTASVNKGTAEEVEASTSPVQALEEDISQENKVQESPTTKPPPKQSSLQKLLSLRASNAKGIGNKGIASTDIKGSINSIKPTLISKRLNQRPKFSLSSRFQQKKKLLGELSQKLENNEQTSSTPNIVSSKGTTPLVKTTVSSLRSTSRFRPLTKTSRTSRPFVPTSKASTVTSKRLPSLRNRKPSPLSPIKPFDLDAAPTRNRFDGSRLSRLSVRPGSKSNSINVPTTFRPNLSTTLSVDNDAAETNKNQQKTTEQPTVGEIIAGLNGDTTEKPEEFVLVRKFKPKFGASTRDKLRKRLQDQLSQDGDDDNSSESPDQSENTPNDQIINQGQGEPETLAPQPKIQGKTRLRSRPSVLRSDKIRQRTRPSNTGVSSKVVRPRTRSRNRSNDNRRPVGAPRKIKDNSAEAARDSGILTDQDIIAGLLLNVPMDDNKELKQEPPVESTKDPIEMLNNLITSQLDSNTNPPAEPEVSNSIDPGLLQNVPKDNPSTLEDFLKSAVVESHLPIVEEQVENNEKEAFLPLAIPHLEQAKSFRQKPSQQNRKTRLRSRAKSAGITRSQITSTQVTTESSRPTVASRSRSRLRVRNRGRTSARTFQPTEAAIESTQTEPKATTKRPLTTISRQRSKSTFAGSRASTLNRSRQRSRTLSSETKGQENKISQVGNVSNLPPAFSTRQPIRQQPLRTKSRTISRSRSRVRNKSRARVNPAARNKTVDENEFDKSNTSALAQEPKNAQPKESPRSGSNSTGKLEDDTTDRSIIESTQKFEAKTITPEVTTEIENSTEDTESITVSDNNSTNKTESAAIAATKTESTSEVSPKPQEENPVLPFRRNFKPKFGLRQRKKIRRKLNGLLKESPVQARPSSTKGKLVSSFSPNAPSTTTKNSTEASAALEISTTTFASVSPANAVTALPAIFFTGTPFGVSPNYDTLFGGISSNPNAFGPTPSPLTRIGRSTVDYSNNLNEIATEGYVEAISGRAIAEVNDPTTSTVEVKKSLKNDIKSSKNNIKKLQIKPFKKGGLFGRKRPNFLKKLNKIAAIEKNERALFHSFKGVNNPNSIKAGNLENIENNNVAGNQIPASNPVLRPRRKFELGAKLPRPKSPSTSQPTTISDDNKSNVTRNSDTTEASKEQNVNNGTDENEVKSITSDQGKDLSTPSSIDQVTSFIPTPPPPKRGGIFPFSFKGPLKPKLLSFSVEKYKKKKKSNHKFSTKVKKQLSDKLKELRGLKKNKAAESVTIPTPANDLENNISVAKTDVVLGTSEVYTTTEPNKSIGSSLLLRNKLKKGRKSFGSKVNLFSKAGLKKFPFLTPTKPSKIVPSTSTISFAKPNPTQSKTNGDLKDEKRFLSRNTKVVFFY